MARRVFVHIGAPKTGSTFVQRVLWSNRYVLKRAGILLPGNPAAHDQAMADLRAVAWRDQSARWSWERLAVAAGRWPGDVIITNEGLGGATADQAGRALADLRAAEVHVVVAARDLWRTFPSMWQQSIRGRSDWSFETFLSAVEQGRYEPFWDNYTANRMLRRWGALVPAERRHLITVPPAGAPHNLLWRRFAEVLGIPDGLCELGPAAPNPSLGAAETEVLRRVNMALGDRYPHRTPYQQVVQRHLIDAVLRGSANEVRLGLGPERVDWVQALAEQQIEELRGYPCHVVGDLAELRPVVPSPAPGGELDDEKIIAAAVQVIIGMLGHADSLGRRADRRYQAMLSRLTTRATRAVRQRLRRPPSARTPADH